VNPFTLDVTHKQEGGWMPPFFCIVRLSVALKKSCPMRPGQSPALQNVGETLFSALEGRPPCRPPTFSAQPFVPITEQRHEKKDTAPNGRARKCLPLDSGSRMSDPCSALYPDTNLLSFRIHNHDH